MRAIRADDLAHRGLQRVALTGRKVLQEQVLGCAREDRTCLAHFRAPHLGDDGEGPPAVGRAARAAEVTGLFDPVAQPRQAALAEPHRVREILHPEAPVGRVGQNDEHLVPGKGDPGFGLEPVADGVGEQGLPLHEGGPQLCLTRRRAHPLILRCNS